VSYEISADGVTIAGAAEERLMEDIQKAVGKVHIEHFRLRLDCDVCNVLAAAPATADVNAEIRGHILSAHRDEVILDD